VHLQHIFEKLDVQTRLGAVMVALRQGWLILA
jgi:DNA-binding CsgD family transcriptional regulator